MHSPKVHRHIKQAHTVARAAVMVGKTLVNDSRKSLTGGGGGEEEEWGRGGGAGGAGWAVGSEFTKNCRLA